jgi:hypothetical protein
MYGLALPHALLSPAVLFGLEIKSAIERKSMKRYTLAEIAAANEAAGYFYFSRSTLKFFNQRKGDFKVRHVAGRVFVFAPSRWDGHLMGYSFAEFNPATGDISKPKEHPGTFVLAVDYKQFFDECAVLGSIISDSHGAELQNLKGLAILPQALLAEKRRTPAVQLDSQEN